MWPLRGHIALKLLVEAKIWQPLRGSQNFALSRAKMWRLKRVITFLLHEWPHSLCVYLFLLNDGLFCIFTLGIRKKGGLVISKHCDDAVLSGALLDVVCRRH